MAGPSDDTPGGATCGPDAAVPRSAKPAAPRSAPTVSPQPVDADLGVDRIVQEIREGLAHISARELELRRREHDFDRRYRDLQERAQQVVTEKHDETQGRLAQQLGELNAQAVEIAASRARLDDDTRELHAQQVELEAQRRELALQTERLRQQAETQQESHALQEAALQERIDQVAQREARLEERTRQAEADRREPQLAARGAQLAEAERALHERVQSVTKQEADLQDRIERAQRDAAHVRTELDGRSAALDADAVRLADTERALQERADQISHQDAELKERIQQSQDELARDRAALDDRSAALDTHAVRLAETEHALQERAEHVSHQEAELSQRMEQAQAELARDRAALDSRSTEVTERAAQLAQAEKALQQRSDALARQEAESTKRIGRAEDDLARRKAELDGRSPELDARAARLTDAERTLLERREELDRRLSEAKAHVARLKQQTPAQPASAPAAAPMLAPALRVIHWPPLSDRRWRRRSTTLAAIAALLAAFGWFVWHPPLHRATTELRLTPGPTSAPSGDVATAPDAAGGLSAGALAEHRRRLLDPQLLAGEANMADLSAAWADACARGRVSVATTDGQPVLRLSVMTRGTAEALRLARAAVTTYAEHVQSRTGSSAPPGYNDLLARRDRLAAELASARAQQTADTTELAVAPDPREREEATAAATQMETELAEIAAKLGEQRAEMAALLASDVPLGSVDPADVEKALTEDAIFQEDQKESQAVALQYRTELSVAMLQVVDPLNAVKKALAQFATSLAEQRSQDPPAEIAPIIEQCATDVANAQSRFTPFAEQWPATLQSVQNAVVRDDVVELVKQQNSVADMTRRLADEAVAATAQLTQHIESLNTSGSGGTRAVVVAAVLRTEQTAVDVAVKAFAAAAGRTALSGNFELDTLDRKLRGLRMRVASRREAVTQRLQLEADHAARQKHTARVEESREQIRRLDQRREELMTTMLAAVRKLRTLDETARQRGALEVQVRQRDAELAWLAARQADVVQQMAEVSANWPPPGTVEFREPVTESISSARYRDAVFAAVGGFCATWLICALLVAQNPWRRREEDRRPDLAHPDVE